MMTPTLPLFIHQLGAQEDVIGLVIGAFTISALLVRPFAGRYIDTRGRKGIYLTGLTIVIISIFCYTLIPMISTLIALRVLHGVGWSASTTAASTIAIDAIPKQKLGEGMSYFGLTSVFALAMAPAIGLEIFYRWGFHTVCYIAMTFAIGGVLLALGIHTQKIKPASQPGQKRNLFEKQAYLPGMLMFLVALTFGSVMAFIAIYAMEFNIQNIGMFFTSYAISLLLTRPFIGKLIDRKGFSATLIPGICCLLATFPFLVFAQNFYFFIAAAIVYGLGMSAVQPTLQTMAVFGVPPERRGAASSTFMCGFDLGMGMGTMLWGMIAKTFSLSVMYACNMVPPLIALTIYLLHLRKEKSIL